MSDTYTINAGLFKALSDRHRLQIVNLLSCGEQCACHLLEHFRITQPTLSHHLKILCDCNLVVARKEGKMTKYSLNNAAVEGIKECLCTITGNPDDCTCIPGRCLCGGKCTCGGCPCKD